MDDETNIVRKLREELRSDLAALRAITERIETVVQTLETLSGRRHCERPSPQISYHETPPPRSRTSSFSIPPSSLPHDIALLSDLAERGDVDALADAIHDANVRNTDTRSLRR